MVTLMELDTRQYNRLLLNKSRKKLMKKISAFSSNEKGIAHLLAIAVIGVLLFIFISSTASFQNKMLGGLFPKPSSHAANSFLATFDGSPTTPQPFLSDPASANWDVAVHSRDSTSLINIEEMLAHHGADCAPPVDASGNLITHLVNSYEGSVFKCKDHIMTSIKNGGYGLIMLTPNQIADFSNGQTVTIKFDMSTLKTSGRDWVDFWITPYEDNLQLPLDVWLPDMQGEPRRAIHLKMDNFYSGWGFRTEVINNFVNKEIAAGPWDGVDPHMAVSPKQRTTFQIELSRTHIKFFIPAGQLDVNGAPINGGQPIIFSDLDMPDLGWDSGVFQISHHSYNPFKDCTADPNKPVGWTCAPDTWHWDTVSISNAIPFTIIKANRRYVSPNVGDDHTDTVIFNAPAPTNSFLRFSGVGTINVSFDNGSTWQLAQKQPSVGIVTNQYHAEHQSSYWMSMPQGTQSVKFQFSPDSWYNLQYMAKDFAIWSSTIPPQPTQTPSVTAVPTPTPTLAPTPTPTVSSNPIAGPNVTKLVTCLSGPTTANVLSINYSGIDYVDISADSTFPSSGFSNKQVTGTTSTQGPGGFVQYPEGTPALVLNPNTTYFSRGYVAASDSHVVNGGTFSFNLCATPTPIPTVPSTPLPTPSNNASSYILEGEFMSLIANSGAIQVFNDGSASGGRGLLFFSNATSNGSVSTNSNTNQVVVRARGDQCQGAPTINVRVDNILVLSTKVSNTAWTDYPVTRFIPAGSHSISISFDNDYNKTKGGNLCDRNLRVDKVTLQ
jgi:hypothetical protein